MIRGWTDARDGTEYRVRIVGWSSVAFWNRDGFWVTGMTSATPVDELSESELCALVDAARSGAGDRS